MINNKIKMLKKVIKDLKKIVVERKKNNDVKESDSDIIELKKRMNINERCSSNYEWISVENRRRNKIFYGFKKNQEDLNEDKKIKVVGKIFKRKERLMKEIKAYEILRGVDGILQPIDLIQDNNEGLILVFPKLKNVRPSHTKEVKKYYDKVIKILEEIHKRSIIHHDIKPSHILQDENGKVFLIDFDFCRLPDENCYHNEGIPGTNGFRPPETAEFFYCDNKVDFYSLDRVKEFWESYSKIEKIES